MHPVFVAVGVSAVGKASLAVMQKQLRERRDEQILARMEEIQQREVALISVGEVDIKTEHMADGGVSAGDTDAPSGLPSNGTVEWTVDKPISLNDGGRLSVPKKLAGTSALEFLGNPLPYRGSHHEMVERTAEVFESLTGGGRRIGRPHRMDWKTTGHHRGVYSRRSYRV